MKSDKKTQAKRTSKKRTRGPGHPVTFTAARKKRFLSVLLKTGGNVTRAAQAVGQSRAIVYEHREKHPAFRVAWDDAIETATERLEQEAIRRAFEGCQKPVYQGGELVGYVQEYSDTLMIFMLKAKRPGVYRERSSVEHSGPGGGPIETRGRTAVSLAQLTDEELDQVAKITERLHSADSGNGSDGNADDGAAGS